MMEEYQSILKNNVLSLEEKSMVTTKRIYKIKYAIDGSIKRYKVRLMARRFSQKEGEDYEEIFAPIVRYTFVKTIISIAFVEGYIRWM